MEKIKNYVKNNKFKFFCLILIIIAFGVWAIWNYFNNKTFLIANFVDIVTIFLLVFVSYFLVENKNNMQKKREIIGIVLDEIQSSAIMIDSLSKEQNFDRIKVTMEIRKLKNDCDLLKKACDYFKIHDAVNYIKKEVDELDSYISEQNIINRENPTVSRHCQNIQYKSKEIYSAIYFDV